MTSVPLGEAKNHLSEYVTDVERTHDRVLITRHGHPAAVLISPEDLAALEETVDILTTPALQKPLLRGWTISLPVGSPTTMRSVLALPVGDPRLRGSHLGSRRT